MFWMQISTSFQKGLLKGYLISDSVTLNKSSDTNGYSRFLTKRLPKVTYFPVPSPI
ncbi:hypothetical protein BACI349Y_560012 [Bacillus sp. 349Y]|nr:hypothetical protein BACI349Y_560012 [Bacillus sp. 349Y]